MPFPQAIDLGRMRQLVETLTLTVLPKPEFYPITDEARQAVGGFTFAAKDRSGVFGVYAGTVRRLSSPFERPPVDSMLRSARHHLIESARAWMYSGAPPFTSQDSVCYSHILLLWVGSCSSPMCPRIQLAYTAANAVKLIKFCGNNVRIKNVGNLRKSCERTMCERTLKIIH